MDAIEQARELLRAGAQAQERDGYLDAAPDRPGLAETPGQQLMQSTLLPQIYEALWRPIGFTVLGGGRTAAAEDRRITELLSVERSERVLDLACGPGNTTRRLAERNRQAGLIVGADASATMLRRAVRDTRDHRIAYVRADAVALPFADETFDAAACIGALYLIDEPFTALDEIVRVLRPGGRMALLTSCYRGKLPLRLTARLITRPGGVRMFSRSEIRDALAQRGIEAVTQDISGFTQIAGGRRSR